MFGTVFPEVNREKKCCLGSYMRLLSIPQEGLWDDCVQRSYIGLTVRSGCTSLTDVQLLGRELAAQSGSGTRLEEPILGGHLGAIIVPAGAMVNHDRQLCTQVEC